MAMTVKDMLTAANEAVPRIDTAKARELIGAGNVLIIDVRDGGEVRQSGKVKGAVHVSRGLLEFKACPESPSHDEAFQKDKTVMVYCGSGGRAALSGKCLVDLGYRTVYNLGGFKDCVEGGMETEPA